MPHAELCVRGPKQWCGLGPFRAPKGLNSNTGCRTEQPDITAVTISGVQRGSTVLCSSAVAASERALLCQKRHFLGAGGMNEPKLNNFCTLDPSFPGMHKER